MGAFEKYGWEEEKIISKTGLRYLVRLQDYVLKNSQGKEEAVMFSFSYLRIPQDSRRPVMFAYNGGPGAASSWIHMGLLGPKQISFPDYPNLTQPIKYQIQENEEFLLDQCDLVLIDPVGASRQEIERAAKKASIHDFIMSLPKGYETQVGELGDTLSGGERQRIGIARAFLHDAPLLLLDEPTSNLDALNEGVILKALREFCRKKTVVLVSHRRSTLNVADRILAIRAKK